MSHDGDSSGPEPVRIGPEGFATLSLSGAVMLLSFGTSLLLAIVYVVWMALRTPSDGPSASRIIVLGMRLNGNGEPGGCYRRRLERALGLWQRSERSQVVLLGGVTRRGRSSEAEAGAAYLRERGVRADAINTEDRSRHTLENFQLYRQRYPTDRTVLPVLVTSRFHIARSSLLAAGLGIAHRRCAAEERRIAVLPHLPRVLFEALLIHWYVTSRSFARLTRNHRIAARLT
jgi:uncharacterized SAM-binding protein YcdF (DUF218 family)